MKLYESFKFSICKVTIQKGCSCDASTWHIFLPLELYCISVDPSGDILEE